MRVTLIAVQSLDGYITHHDKPGASFASPEDGLHLRNILQQCDATIMGANTFRDSLTEIASKSPPGRLRVVRTFQPELFAQESRSGSLEFSNEEASLLCARLVERGIRRCGLLGGTQNYTEFLQKGLVDELCLTLEPVTFGSGMRLLDGAHHTRWRLQSTESLNQDTLLLRYSRV